MKDERQRHGNAGGTNGILPTPTPIGDGGTTLIGSGSDPTIRVDGAVSTEAPAVDSSGLSAGHRWGTAAEDDELPMNTVFEIAKNERRQLVLRYIAGQDRPVSLGELAEHIASIENDKPVSAITSAERKRVYVGLHQCHLPKMEDAKVIDVDRQEGITLGEHAAEVLDVLDADGDGWYRYYGAVAGLGVVLFVISNLGPIQSVAPLVLGGYVAIVAAVALFHAYAVR